MTDTWQTSAKPTPILVGVDRTDSALAAARWAADEARAVGAPLVLVHAATYIDAADESSPEVKRARAILARAWSEASRSAPGVNARTELLLGTPTQALARMTATARLVAVGLTGHGEIDEIPLGVTAVGLARHATCPVVGVRSWPLPAGEARDVLVGVHDVTEDAAAIEAAFQEAEQRRCAVVVLHCDPSGSADPQSRAQHGRALAARLTDWRRRYPGVELRCEVEHDNPDQALLRRSERAALVVVGQRSRAIHRALFGSTSRWLLRHSHVPVMVMPRAAVTTDV